MIHLSGRNNYNNGDGLRTLQEARSREYSRRNGDESGPAMMAKLNAEGSKCQNCAHFKGGYLDEHDICKKKGTKIKWYNLCPLYQKLDKTT